MREVSLLITEEKLLMRIKIYSLALTARQRLLAGSKPTARCRATKLSLSSVEFLNTEYRKSYWATIYSISFIARGNWINGSVFMNHFTIILISLTIVSKRRKVVVSSSRSMLLPVIRTLKNDVFAVLSRLVAEASRRDPRARPIPPKLSSIRATLELPPRQQTGMHFRSISKPLRRDNARNESNPNVEFANSNVQYLNVQPTNHAMTRKQPSKLHIWRSWFELWTDVWIKSQAVPSSQSTIIKVIELGGKLSTLAAENKERQARLARQEQMTQRWENRVQPLKDVVQRLAQESNARHLMNMHDMRLLSLSSKSSRMRLECTKLLIPNHLKWFQHRL
jgi:hypothetical protein